MKERNKDLYVMTLVFALIFALVSTIAGGCLPKIPNVLPEDEPESPASPEPVEETMTVDLYFADDQAMEIIPESREIRMGVEPGSDTSLERLVVSELIKGPQDPLLRPTVPPEARVISVKVLDGLAVVDFSEELVTKHPGGSTGELITVTSLVNTLTSLPSIDRVQITVQGEKIETLAGHIDLSGESTRTLRPGDFFVSEERAKTLQERVDSGEELWRKDPVEVAKREAPAKGFLPSLDYKLVLLEDGHALVQVTYEGSYLIGLCQPKTLGDEGIWVIESINLKESG